MWIFVLQSPTLEEKKLQPLLGSRVFLYLKMKFIPMRKQTTHEQEAKPI